MRPVAMPLAVGALPKNTPATAAADELHLGDGILDGPVRLIEKRSYEKEFDVLACKALSFPNLVADFPGRPAFRPEDLFD